MNLAEESIEKRRQRHYVKKVEAIKSGLDDKYDYENRRKFIEKEGELSSKYF